jgi:hypothetical protein
VEHANHDHRLRREKRQDAALDPPRVNKVVMRGDDAADRGMEWGRGTERIGGRRRERPLGHLGHHAAARTEADDVALAPQPAGERRSPHLGTNPGKLGGIVHEARDHIPFNH